MEHIAFDVHKHYTLATVERPEGGMVRETRLDHSRGAFRCFLRRCEAGSPVAIETVGNWYWVVDEVEAAGFRPQLVHARRAKMMLGAVNKTDKLDNRGMNRLQRSGTLPTVWIPPAEIRDVRDLPRTRMVLVQQRTALKNRTHSALDKYGLTITEAADIFTGKGRRLLEERLEELPTHTRYATRCVLTMLDSLEGQIDELERRIAEVIRQTPEMRLLMTMTGVGPILATVIAVEIGDIRRFATAAHLAAYAGTTPRIHASGGKRWSGPVSSEVNRYLKWAFVEAAGSLARHHVRHPERRLSQTYKRIRERKGHGKAVVAVARRLAEAAFWMLTRNEPYRESVVRTVSSTEE